ncbi:hypothetical protein BCR42DRAFT_426446 [Absidia repens]|uniref:F-box domain-containing protein n=1 Tax=Absidia repens TaxID=90262 RepID=A0A1X2I1I6_9FUNG|nr:hypothetical protein BCR42DRAFT_426446 [Absidia repens]
MTAPSFLPTEIVSLIIQHADAQDLKACTLVNKQFCTVAQPLILWRTIHLKRKNKRAGYQMINQIVTAHPSVGHHIRHLDLGSSYTWKDDALLLLMPHVRLLETLILRNAEQLTDVSLEHLPRHCPELRSLDVGNSRITTISFDALRQFCPHLWQLTLGTTTKDLAADAFVGLGSPCRLKALVLNLEHYEDDDDEDGGGGFFEEDDPADPFCLTGFHHLTHLTIHHGPMRMLERLFPTYDGDDGDDPAVARFALPALTHLTLYDCPNVVDEMLVPFLETHPDLQSLEVYGSGDLCDGTLEAIAEFIPNIRNVRIDDNINITHHGLRQLVRRCRLLTTVSCANTEINAEEIPEAGEHCLNLMVSEDEDIYLEWLDEDAIDTIRKDKPEDEVNSNNNNDADADDDDNNDYGSDDGYDDDDEFDDDDDDE